MLKIKGLEGWDGGDIRRQISIEVVGSEAQYSESIEISNTIGWDGA